ncbi:MAG: hypothetical protein MUO76_21915 [Anaerolineaceae bacterium]|jgi:hypothetical protein|nr:hypothetical protein [Anaerolineaceae bacterium]
MKVSSKLVKMDFVFGKIERKDQYLIIHSHPESTMPAKVRMDAIDLWSFVKAMLNLSVIGYVLSLPVLYRKAKRQAQTRK